MGGDPNDPFMPPPPIAREMHDTGFESIEIRPDGDEDDRIESGDDDGRQRGDNSGGSGNAGKDGNKIIYLDDKEDK